MSNLKPITHVIFDLDGTLVDSESLLLTAIENLCKKYNKIPIFEVNQKLLGYPFKERAKQLYEDLAIDLNFGQFINELITDCIQNVTQNGMHLMPGVERIINYFKDNKIPMAIASGNTSKSYEETAQRFGNLFDNFSHAVLSGDERNHIRPKPYPDIYLKTWERFTPKPVSVSNVLVFEDTDVGVESAISAGMKCVYVLDKRLNISNDSDIATLVIHSLEEFKPEVFGLSKFE